MPELMYLQYSTNGEHLAMMGAKETFRNDLTIAEKEAISKTKIELKALATLPSSAVVNVDVIVVESKFLLLFFLPRARRNICGRLIHSGKPERVMGR
jgi:hypothetical protein